MNCCVKVVKEMSPRSSSEKASSQSSDKLLQILECIAENRLPLRLQELSERVGMTQPTVLRYLNALQNANYVYQDEDTLRYALTWRICRLSENLNNLAGLRSIASSFVTQLSSQLNLGSCLVMAENGRCVYLDCVDTISNTGHTLQRIGKSSPLHATGSGKVLLSSYNRQQIDTLVEEQGLEALTQYTITDKNALLQELEQVRAQGYAMDEEECELDLRCISYPLYNYNGTIVAALSVFGEPAQMTDERIQADVKPLLSQAAATISRRLGYEPQTPSRA